MRLLGYDLYLVKLELDRGLAAEHGNDDVDRIVVHIDAFHRAGEAELAVPQSLAPGQLRSSRSRTVCYTDLDRNGHMNNTRCLDWVYDLLPSEFHRAHPLREFTVCYFSEGREGQELTLRWDFPESGVLQADSYRREEDREVRVFSLRIRYE